MLQVEVGDSQSLIRPLSSMSGKYMQMSKLFLSNSLTDRFCLIAEVNFRECVCVSAGILIQLFSEIMLIDFNIFTYFLVGEGCTLILYYFVYVF